MQRWCSLFILLSSCISWNVSAATNESKRGVYFFDSSVPCPLADVGQRPNKSCVRIALDDDRTILTFDQVTKKILLVNDFDYPNKTLIADIALPASLKSKSIGDFGGIVHIKIEKSAHHFIVNSHAHMSNLRDFSGDPVIDSYEVSLRDGKTGKLVTSQKLAMEQLKSKVASFNFVQITPWSQAESGQAAAAAEDDRQIIVDRKVSAGLKSLNKQLARFSFTLPKDAKTPTSVTEALKHPKWQLSIETLTSLLPKADVQHDLFLYGLTDFADLNDLSKGTKKGAKIVISASEGSAGTIAFAGKEVQVPNLLEAVRQFLEFNSLGIAFRADLQAALGQK